MPTSLDEPNAVSDAASTPTNWPPQLDGSRDDTPPATPMRAPKKPSTVEPSQLSDPDLSGPHPSASKKRKRETPYHKERRSHDRLKTINNPPLNDDCVIAFAESANKTDETGVLRQVKSERQGNFVEDSVVLAVRFFIAGDGKLEIAGDEEMGSDVNAEGESE